MMNTNLFKILLFALGLLCTDRMVAAIQNDSGNEIVRALSELEEMLPDEVTYPRPLLTALSDFAESPTPARKEKIAALVSEMLGDMEARSEFMATAGSIAMAGVMLDDHPVSWLWRLAGWGRMAKRMDQGDPLHQALLSMTVEAAMDKGLPIVPEASAWYSDSKKILMAPPALTIQMSDRDFLNRLKDGHPGLENVIAARDKGDLVSAKKAYAAYLRKTKTLSDDAMYLRTDHEALIPQAEELMENIWTINTHMSIKHNYGPVIGVYSEILNDLESLVDINKHLQLATLAKVYRGTENPKYHEKLALCPIPVSITGPVPGEPWRLAAGAGGHGRK
jgi:hypothetical protein